MAKFKGVHDGYLFDFDLPTNRPVTGEEVKEGMARALGRIPEGAPAVRRESGELVHLAAKEPVEVRPGDSFTVTPAFETAGP